MYRDTVLGTLDKSVHKTYILVLGELTHSSRGKQITNNKHNKTSECYGNVMENKGYGKNKK